LTDILIKSSPDEHIYNQEMKIQSSGAKTYVPFAMTSVLDP